MRFVRVADLDFTTTGAVILPLYGTNRSLFPDVTFVIPNITRLSSLNTSGQKRKLKISSLHEA
jgi:hypothetical protein